MPGSASNVLQFDRFTLDLARGQLRADDRVLSCGPRASTSYATWWRTLTVS